MSAHTDWFNEGEEIRVRRNGSLVRAKIVRSGPPVDTSLVKINPLDFAAYVVLRGAHWTRHPQVLYPTEAMRARSKGDPHCPLCDNYEPSDRNEFCDSHIARLTRTDR